MIYLKFLREKWKNRPIAVSGAFAISAFVILFSACFSTSKTSSADKKNFQPQESTTNNLTSKTPSSALHNSLNEWSAFAIYHPQSNLNEDHSIYAQQKNTTEDGGENDVGGSAKTQNGLTQILGAKALIPILRATFGDEVRGSTEFERDVWFTTHPSALFTPEQMNSLCDATAEAPYSSVEPCWKPHLSEGFLSALTEFASDACPQLVGREFKNSVLQQNKLVRTRDFKEQNLRYFAQNSLRVPPDKLTQAWLESLTEEVKKSLLANGHIETNNNEDPQYRSEDLYALACQAILLSKEFYSR